MCSATVRRQIVMEPDFGHSLGASVTKAQDLAQTWGHLGNLLGDGSGPDSIWEDRSPFGISALQYARSIRNSGVTLQAPAAVLFQVVKIETEHSLLRWDRRRGLVYRLFGREINEVSIVSDVIGAELGTMIDVGAHWGGCLAQFLERGWTVYAIEPDTDNRAKLAVNFPKATIDSRAVSERDGETVRLFTSDISAGISTLSPFHPTHEPTSEVRTVRLDTFINEYGIQRVDFLKTDVEGYDLLALRTFPWDKLRPKAVVCEFEDNKTNRLGYASHDMAKFLQDRGYAVVVSEWYPIVQYGTEHRWRRFAHYPTDIPSDSWGNLIAVEPRLLDQVDRSCEVAIHRDRARRKAEQLLRLR